MVVWVFNIAVILTSFYRFLQYWVARRAGYWRLASISTVNWDRQMFENSSPKSSESATTGELESKTETYLHNDSCCVCLEDFVDDVSIAVLPCKHGFHQHCVKIWIEKKRKCPICIRPL